MRVRYATRADLGRLIDIGEEAFLDDELFSVLLLPGNRQYPAAWRRFMVERQKRKFCTKGLVGVVCVDDDDHVLGYAWWQRKVPKSMPEMQKTDQWLNTNTSWTSKFEGALLDMETQYDMLFRMNKAADYETMTRIFSQQDSCLDPIEKATVHWYLSVLGVAPEAQRRGVGRMLVDWGIDQARQESAQAGQLVPLTLLSSPMGLGLYAKKDFKIIGWEKMSLENSAFQGGAAFVWDPSCTWIKLLPEGTEVVLGRPVHAAWTERTLKAAGPVPSP